MIIREVRPSTFTTRWRSHVQIRDRCPLVGRARPEWTRAVVDYFNRHGLEHPVSASGSVALDHVVFGDSTDMPSYELKGDPSLFVDRRDRSGEHFIFHGGEVMRFVSPSSHDPAVRLWC